MITASDKSTIQTLAARYAVKRGLLFGSAAKADSGYRDIDLAVEGIRAQDFFRFYGDLLNRLPFPVDVVDLSKSSRFTQMILKEGIQIYG